MWAGKRIGIGFLCLLLAFAAAAQQKTKAQLQKERQENLQKIKEVEKILDETNVQKKSTLGELNALNQRISIQEKLIQSFRSELALLDREIATNNGFILALQEDLNKLREEYASMLFAAQKANNSATRLAFLFSADSFDQLLMRLRYMRQYAKMRKIQVNAIQQVQAELGVQVKQIEARRSEKNVLLTQELDENNNLNELRKKQNTVVKNLEKQEKSLRTDLENTKKALAVLDKRINDIIREEMERTARETNRDRTTVTTALSNSFEENKSKFPWPVSGFVSQKFGRQNHPVLKGIIIQNDGVNIQTKENEKVKSIFEGEVRYIAVIPPFGNSVIISHGEYFTVYAGLKEVYVKKGQQVKTNQEIGQVLSNADGISELRFQIRKSTTALDPQLWLRN
ncbi:MAG: peptidoglycan DD-metalloendopeptidase family protein [Cyclobacteriaceae bacterium]|jgi:septal ring factor EnvC (AmiA/AmiB activator)|nr:peptidoglycan DD-metalloendopeptidase family protein [Cyclobacteriaceae bacterium]